MTDERVSTMAQQNIRAKMEALDLWHHVRWVHRAFRDRIYVEADTTLPLALARCPKMESARVSLSHHRQLFEALGLREGPLSGYRENARPSLQVSYYVGQRAVYADIDIDLGNPVRDVIGAVVHVLEVVWPGKTDPVRVRRELLRDPVIASRLVHLEEHG